jgi:hypothetical protein
MSLRPVLAVALAASLVLVPAVQARAQGSTDTRDEARALFLKGKRLGAKHDWSGAFDALKRSFQIRASYDTAADLAYAALKLERYAEAARRASYALQHQPTGETARRRKAVGHIFDEALAHVAQVKLTLDPSDATVSVDGGPAESGSKLGGALFLDAGKHTVEASADGYEPHSETVDAQAGGIQTLELKLAPVADASAPPRMPESGPAAAPSSGAPPAADTGTKPLPPPPASRPLWPALVGGGVAVAGLATGIGFSLAASSASSDHDAKLAALSGSNPCGAGTPNATECAKIADLGSTAARDHNVATASFVVAGVFAVATIAYIVWPHSKAANQLSSNTLRLSGTVVPHFAAVNVSGSF